MYQKPNYAQTDIYDFILPFGGHLDENNRWVILRRSIDWKIIHEIYEKNFDNKDTGNVALSAEIAAQLNKKCIAIVRTGWYNGSRNR